MEGQPENLSYSSVVPKVLGMTQFMSEVGSFQDARNLAALQPDSERQPMTGHSSESSLPSTPFATTGGGGGRRPAPEESSGSFSHPFKLTTSVVSSTPKYKVHDGSITDGTNGDAIDLSLILNDDLTATDGFVVIEADVDEDLEVSGWNLLIVTDADDAAEVRLTTDDPPVQDKLRLLIGKLALDDDVAIPTQALITSVRITHGILNGALVKVFEAAPSHPDDL